MVIHINDQLSIDEAHIQIDFVQSSGPGGQNVNKLATKAQLRFDLSAACLPEEMQARLTKLAGKRLTQDGFLVITAGRYRSQEQNRLDAMQRLETLLIQATKTPKTRRPTRPTKASQHKRLESKRRRGLIKRMRRNTTDD